MGPERLVLLGSLEALSWRLTYGQGAGRQEESGEGLPALHARLGAFVPDAIAWALLPEQALRLTLPVPGRRLSQQRRAAPFLLEEYLSEPLDGLHITTAERARDGQLGLLAVAQDGLRADLATLAEGGLTPDGVYALTDLLDGESTSVLWLTSEEDGLFLSPASGDQLRLSPALLEGLAPGFLKTEALSVVWDGDAVPLAWQAALDGQGLKVSALLPHLPLGEAPGPFAVNALQAPFAPRVRARQNAALWRRPAQLAAALAALAFGSQLAEGLWLQGQAAEQEAQLASRFATLWPERGGKSPNPRRELSLLLSGAGSGGSGALMPYLDVLAAGLGPQQTLDQLRFQSDRGTLSLELSTDSLSTLQGLQQALQADGRVAVAMDNAAQDQSGVRARLTLTGRF